MNLAFNVGADLDETHLLVEGDALYVIAALKGDDRFSIWKNKAWIDEEITYLDKWMNWKVDYS